MNDAAPIFISYRRSDAAGHARPLHEHLAGRFGDHQIFFDRSAIEGGDVFPDTLRQGVERCAVLIALIAPGWLDVAGADGGRRLDDPHDFVRQEIALALEGGKKVIPVLFDDTPVPPADRLPEPLKALARCDALTLRGKTYEYAAQRRELVRLLAKVPGVPEPLPEAGETIAGGIAEQLPAIIEAATQGLQQLNEVQQDTIRSLERQLGANAAQLDAFFQIIGEAQVPPEQQLTRLVEIAAQFRQLRAQVAIEPGDAPQVAKLKHAARAALDAGRLQEADHILARVETAQDAVLDRQQREVDRQQMERAATAAQRGVVALTRLRYAEAAQHFAAAAKRVPPGQEEQRLACLDQEAQALYHQGEEFGNNTALVDAIDRYHALLDRRPRERVPLDWAMTQHNLGTALSRLGERERGTERLREAVEAYRDALRERTRGLVPFQWAMTENNLGNALAKLGERESGTESLEEAVVTYREVLKVYTCERAPLDWAMTQNNLGNTLRALGERESGTKRLEEAAHAHREAIKGYPRERVPLDWATIQSNLGIALARLGERANDIRCLEEAVEACREALKERTRDCVPLRWAATQNNLGNVLRVLGEQENNARRLEEAVEAFHQAASEWTRDRVPLQWAGIQNNLGNVLRVLGERESGTGRLEEAVDAYREALKERTRERVPAQWATTRNNLGNALLTIGERTRDVAMLREARRAINAAFEIFIQAGQQHYRAYFEDRLREIDSKIADLSKHPGAPGSARSQ